jgi:uncharacterized repeat protein (TIGR03833 family)
MKLLKIIKDSDPENEESVKYREGSRAVLFDEDGLVPLLFVSKYNFHKLPGGGIESGESQEQALKRECQEEIGCEIEVGEEIGKIMEYRSQYNLQQTNYCYLGTIVSKGEPSLEEDEIEEGYRTVWMSLPEAIQAIETDEPECYEGIFIQKRESVFLKEASRLLSKSTDDQTRSEGPSEHSQNRKMIRPGSKVFIVLKKDQPTGKLTQGVVQDLLTNKLNHPRGIKVRLTTGQVGRVQKIL